MITRRGMVGAGGAGLALGGAGLAWGAAKADMPAFRAATAGKLQALAATLDAPGVSLGLARHGRAVGFWSQGYASLPFRAPVRPRTLFHTGSDGKHVTALGVLQLMEAGRLRLDDPIGTYVKDLPAAWAKRPVRALLTHTSGIPDYAEVLTDWDRPQPRRAVIAAVEKAPMEFEPAETWSYSNTNYVLLGWLIEDLSGLSYADYVRSRLFAPARLPHARPDAAQEVIADRAEPYETVDGRFRHAVQMENGVSAAPDGGLLFSALDAAPWGAALDTHRLVSAASMAKAIHPTRLKTGRDAPYGFGWFIDRTRGQDIQRHTGAVPGFISAFVRMPAQGLTAVVLSNGEVSSAVLTDMAMTAAEATAPGSTWMSLAPISDGTDARSRRVRAILGRGEAKGDPAWFAEEIRIRLKGPAGDAAVPKAQNALRSVAPVEDYPVTGGRMIRYRLSDTKRTAHRLVGFTDDDRIFWI
jgi:D-alanyl-D-alanine carboxypeptidase